MCVRLAKHQNLGPESMPYLRKEKKKKEEDPSDIKPKAKFGKTVIMNKQRKWVFREENRIDDRRETERRLFNSTEQESSCLVN